MLTRSTVCLTGVLAAAALALPTQASAHEPRPSKQGLSAEQDKAPKQPGSARRGHEAPQKDVGPRVRLLEELRGKPDALKLPQDARRDASAGVFI